MLCRSLMCRHCCFIDEFAYLCGLAHRRRAGREDTLIKNQETSMIVVTARCNYAGTLGKQIPTRSFAAFLFAHLRAGPLARLRW